jgi:dynein assembly factor 1, axonemal
MTPNAAEDTEDAYNRLRAREKARAQASQLEAGLPVMTPLAIREAALDDNGYETPELNDRLYLHFKGYRRIENLEAYTKVKALWLGSNGLEKIENIGHMHGLRCLYLQQNLIHTISGLEGLNNLVQLDLSQNRLTKLSGLSHIPALHTLNVNKNALQDADSIAHLQECASLTNLDITANSLEGEGVVAVLQSIPSLVALSVTGNPFISQTAHFRKTLLTSMPALRYLDRPVFEGERVAAAAWLAGGSDAEAAARADYQAAQRQKDKDQLSSFRSWQAEQRRKSAERIAERRAAGLPDVPEPSAEEAAAAAERAAAANAEAQRERELLREVGVARMGARFWANASSSSVEEDIRVAAAQAAEQLARDRELEASIAAASTDVVAADAVVEGEQASTGEATVVELTDGAFDASVVAEQQGQGGATAATITDNDAPTAHEEAQHLQQPSTECAVDDDTAVVEVQVEQVEAEPDSEQLQAERAAEEQRAKLVAESMAIYRAQMAKAEQPAAAADVTTDVTTNVTATSAVNVAPCVWSAALDEELTAAVYSLTFDFEAVAAALTAQHPAVAGITAAACRVRWSQLDADSDDDVADYVMSDVRTGSADQLPPVPQQSDRAVVEAVEAVTAVAPVSPSVLENAKLSYDQLLQRAAPSRYLEKPAVLPSMSDDGDTTGSDSEEVGAAAAAEHQEAVLSREEMKARVMQKTAAATSSSSSSRGGTGGASRAPAASVAGTAGAAAVGGSTGADDALTQFNELD